MRVRRVPALGAMLPRAARLNAKPLGSEPAMPYGGQLNTAVLSLVAWTVTLQPDANLVLGVIEKDLTGDGQPEILRLVGVERAVDHVDVTLTIESPGRILFRFQLAPLTRTVGYDAGRVKISAEEYLVRLKEFPSWFFAKDKFHTADQFVEYLRAIAPAGGRSTEIPDVIDRQRTQDDARDASEIWDEILKSPGVNFTFSPGGDAVYAIGWSERAGRFYPLLECC